ncbi:MAG: tyrosine-protein phosphatase, partial [Polyangiaceae bacterium]
GGLAGMHSVVPTGQFFRSASTSHATEHDKAILLARGVVADVDLRTYWEALASPDALADDPRFHYQRVSLFGLGMLDWLTFSPGDRGASYMDALASHQSDFRKVFHALASQPRGAVLFHCASGKDRTGIVAAILLSLAGVERSVIVHDYAISAHYLFPDAESHDEHAHAINGSPPPAIESFLEALDNQYGGARAYLRTIGVSEEDIETLSEKLGQ